MKDIDAEGARQISLTYKDPYTLKLILVRIRYAAELGFMNATFFFPMSISEPRVRQWEKALVEKGFCVDVSAHKNERGNVNGYLMDVDWQ